MLVMKPRPELRLMSPRHVSSSRLWGHVTSPGSRHVSWVSVHRHGASRQNRTCLTSASRLELQAVRDFNHVPESRALLQPS